MTKDISAEINEVEDPVVKGLLLNIIAKIEKIESLPPCSNDPKQIAQIVNRITGKL